MDSGEGRVARTFARYVVPSYCYVVTYKFSVSTPTYLFLYGDWVLSALFLVHLDFDIVNLLLYTFFKNWDCIAYGHSIASSMLKVSCWAQMIKCYHLCFNTTKMRWSEKMPYFLCKPYN